MSEQQEIQQLLKEMKNYIIEDDKEKLQESIEKLLLRKDELCQKEIDTVIWVKNNKL